MGLETTQQQSTAFGVVPGQTPGTTPPILPSPQSAAAPVDEQTKRMLAMLMAAAQQKKFAGQPRPSAVPGKQDPFGAPSYMTSGPNPHAWGAQRFMYGIQSMMRNAVSHQKEEQINKATADWEYAQSALNEYYAAQSSNDPKQLEAAQKKLAVAFDDKKLAKMAKALNQDWMHPEKTTVWGEALKRVAANTQQTDQKKQQAKSGLMGLFQKLMHRKQQPQLTDDEKQRMRQEIISKAPTQTTVDTKQLQEQEKLLHDHALEAKAAGRAEAAESYRKAEQQLRRDREDRETKAQKDREGDAQLTRQERERHDRAMENRRNKATPTGDLTPAQKLARQKTLNLYVTQKDADLRKAEDTIRKRYGLTGMAATEAWPKEATDDLLSEKQRVQDEYETKLSNLGESVTHFDYSSRGTSQNGNGVKLDRSNQEHRRIAKQILDEAGGDPEKARKIARERNFKF